MKKICLCLVLLMLITATIGCKRKDDFDPSKYYQYICHDSNLVCIDVGEGYAKENVQLIDEHSYWCTYYRPEGTSDDQFVCVTMSHIFMSPKTYVFQNPENLVDVWKDWTIRDIQVYYEDLEQKPSQFEGQIARIPGGIVAATSDAECIAQLIHCITSEETPVFSPIRQDPYMYGDLYYQPLKTSLYIRVFFHESESIVWDSEIECYRNGSSGNYCVTMYRDDTIWDEENTYFYIHTQEIGVENLPALEQFLLDALEGFSAEDLEK